MSRYEQQRIRVEKLYYAAAAADEAYSAAIRQVWGPQASRWDNGTERHPVVAKAYQRKVTADRRYTDAVDAMRAC